MMREEAKKAVKKLKDQNSSGVNGIQALQYHIDKRKMTRMNEIGFGYNTKERKSDRQC